MPRVNQMDLMSAITGYLGKKEGVTEINSRQYNAIIEAANVICDALAQEDRQSEPGEGIREWFDSDSTGSSSKFMACIMQLGSHVGHQKYAHPHDVHDFRRCLIFLKACPNLRKRLHLMSKESLFWESLVQHWDFWENLYKECKDSEHYSVFMKHGFPLRKDS